MEKRYKALRLIATIYRVVGIILGVLVGLAALGLFLTIVLGPGGLAPPELWPPWGRSGVLPWWSWYSLLAMPRALGGVILAVIIIVGGGLHALAFYGLGELINLLIALEENTRATAAAVHPSRT